MQPLRPAKPRPISQHTAQVQESDALLSGPVLSCPVLSCDVLYGTAPSHARWAEWALIVQPGLTIMPSSQPCSKSSDMRPFNFAALAPCLASSTPETHSRSEVGTYYGRSMGLGRCDNPATPMALTTQNVIESTGLRWSKGLGGGGCVLRSVLPTKRTQPQEPRPETLRWSISSISHAAIKSHLRRQQCTALYKHSYCYSQRRKEPWSARKPKKKIKTTAFAKITH